MIGTSHSASENQTEYFHVEKKALLRIFAADIANE
jgi:hypothetical protein